MGHKAFGVLVGGEEMCAHCTESEARGCLAYNATYVKEYCGGANPGCLRCMHDKAECSYSSLHQMRSPSDKVASATPGKRKIGNVDKTRRFPEAALLSDSELTTNRQSWTYYRLFWVSSVDITISSRQ
ncbi:hypothetical protein BU26DRAFT_562019 [Trematosphaeria pertusa]|uniref:Zn(2)-C6 fungal-type domain-containing protein n=1 Tax=Trematosphaeria pertusa TaxID=390896 RepID=A0A6A6IPT1_9PLEO|nr:uncharacterized protein BU26DRAFT_562019 [Trematosphaeria pertusa]KAF2252269.1 hypothetical protein BU26DRAFT_562019 [Trematosphaeria pertusa]